MEGLWAPGRLVQVTVATSCRKAAANIFFWINEGSLALTIWIS